jgi:hypothetical protein
MHRSGNILNVLKNTSPPEVESVQDVWKHLELDL